MKSVALRRSIGSVIPEREDVEVMVIAVGSSTDGPPNSYRGMVFNAYAPSLSFTSLAAISINGFSCRYASNTLFAGSAHI